MSAKRCCRFGWRGTKMMPFGSTPVTEAEIQQYMEFCLRVGEKPVVRACSCAVGREAKRMFAEWKRRISR